MNHPDSERTMLTGYPQSEPELFSHCAYCGQEIFELEEMVMFPGNENVFCGDDCVLTLMYEEGNLERRVAGDDTVRIL